MCYFIEMQIAWRSLFLAASLCSQSLGLCRRPMAQEGEPSQSVSEQEIAELKELLERAREERIAAAAEGNKHRNRPARFFLKVDALLSTYGAGKRTDTARSDGIRYCAILP